MPHETFWNNIQQLPAGHCLSINIISPIQVPQTKQWYDFVARIQQIPEMSEEELQTRYFELLHDALALRFRADVAVGMNVSGGLDSSTLIALVAQYLKGDAPIDAYTFYCNDERYDELPWVEKLLQKHHFPLRPVLFEVEKIPELIRQMCAIQDEPFGGFPTMAYSQLFKKARAMGRLVLLDGQGMDEAWAGYDYYHTNSQSVVQGVQSSPVRPEVLTDDFKALARVDTYPKPFTSEMQNKQYRDLFYTKLPRALRFNDRISMMYSTELREPFLDYRLVELAFAQSDDRKYKNGQSKWMLRELVTSHLGNDLALAPKRALQTPQREWLSGALAPFVADKIAQLSTQDFIKPEALNQCWNDYLNGEQDNSFYIWQWINLAQIM
jgi:asparagine synthase (glutamine-hydrolysing)